jgi:hypothetical protein
MAAIAVIPKLGKDDYSLPKCHRPVALLECLDKLLEKVMARWLTYDIILLGLIPSTQFRACPHSSTTDAGLCLTHDMEISHMLGSIYGTLIFDIQDFFNNINHTQLVALVQSLGFSPVIYKWITSFLSNRAVHLYFNNFTSSDIDFELGTPQGSPLSPILSIIYASPLLHLTRSWNGATLNMFIDNGNIFMWAASYKILASRLSSFYTVCHDWCR